MKLITVIFIGLLLLNGFNIAALPSNDQSLQLTCHFSSITITDNQDCTDIKLDGTNNLFTKYNHYTIPTRVETFTFPVGTKIESIYCQPIEIHEENIKNKLEVNPDPVTLGYDSLELIKPKSNPITIDKWYEYTIGSGIIENERKIFLKVELFPIQYNEKSSSIQWSEYIDIEIKYKSPKVTSSLNEQYDFLIISPSIFIDELEPLVIHKNELGLKTILVKLEEIYNGNYFSVEGRDNPEKIKYFIKNAIEEWGIHSVLIVGDDELFPVREPHVYVEYFDVDEPFVSDLYYADIYNADESFSSWDSNNNNIFGEFDWGNSHSTDMIDLYPDIKIGRLACIDEFEVTTCVNKIILYEADKAYTKEWFTNLVVIGGDTFTGDTWSINEGEYMNSLVIDILDGFIPDKIWDTNGRLSAPNPNGVKEITDAINNGCGFIHFSGHGSPNSWATHPNENENIWIPKPWGYFNTNIKNLENNEKLPIVVLGACSTCKFNVLNNCLGWSFLSNPNGGGIGSFGVTTFGYANGAGKKMSEGFVGEMIFNIFEAYSELITREESITFGELWNHAIVDYISTGMEVRDIATIESFQPFGDPTLIIAGSSQAPIKPETPDGPTSIELGKVYTYSSVTIDPEADDIYYLFDWGDDSISEWIGPFESGENVEMNHSWNDKGSYQIKIKAKDEHGQQSEWSDSLHVTLSKSKTVYFPYLQKILERLNFICNNINYFFSLFICYR